MPDRIVELGRFQDEPSAWLARAELEAAGIPSRVISGHSNVPLPPLFRLAVREEDVEAALAILKSAAAGPSA
jgi:hypothetical protein